jgi:hypothetical protein
MTVTISLATNDEHGNETGKLSAVQLGNGALDLQWGEIGSEPRYRLLYRKFLFIQRRRYDVTAVHAWYGNWCWTGVSMQASEAVKLLNNLSNDDRWHCEGGWCDLSDAYAVGAVTAELLADVDG